MGSIINLVLEDGNEIYDGQQRMITTMLILISIGIIEETLYDQIMTLLKMNIILDRLTKEQTGWKKDGFQNIPKISCVNPNDMKALLYIFNNKIKFNYNCMELKIFKEDEWDKDNNKFKCAFCNIEFSRKSNFSKHYETAQCF